MFNGRLEGIQVHTELAADLPNVMADPAAIQRAVANLVDNAAEAMQDAIVREITISTSLVVSRDAVELVVADTGHGVSRDVKERLFLPYFSTKQRGTGLGLAIVSRIVEDHRRIDSRRREQAGRQPVCGRTARSRRSRSALRRQVNMAQILIVDDESGIRESLTGHSRG